MAMIVNDCEWMQTFANKCKWLWKNGDDCAWMQMIVNKWKWLGMNGDDWEWMEKIGKERRKYWFKR